MSELCRLIYRKDASEGVDTLGLASRNDFLERVGLIGQRFFSGPTNKVALIETVETGDGAFAALVFRGTTGRLSNWLSNLDMVACEWLTGGNVHRGFSNILMKLWDTIASALEVIEKPLYYTAQLPVTFDN